MLFNDSSGYANASQCFGVRTLPLFFTVAQGGMTGQRATLAALPSRNETSVLIEYEAGWAPEPIWTFRRRDIPAGNRTQARATCIVGTRRSTKSRVRFFCFIYYLLLNISDVLFLLMLSKVVVLVIQLVTGDWWLHSDAFRYRLNGGLGCMKLNTGEREHQFCQENRSVKHVYICMYVCIFTRVYVHVHTQTPFYFCMIRTDTVRLHYSHWLLDCIIWTDTIRLHCSDWHY